MSAGSWPPVLWSNFNTAIMFLLSGLRNPNNHNKWLLGFLRLHKAGYQPDKLFQDFPKYSWAHSHERGGVSCSCPIANNTGLPEAEQHSNTQSIKLYKIQSSQIHNAGQKVSERQLLNAGSTFCFEKKIKNCRQSELAGIRSFGHTQTKDLLTFICKSFYY